MSQTNAVVARETYCSEDAARTFVKSTNKYDIEVIALEDARISSTNIWRSLKNVFLPHGYPHTVSDDYIQYQLWDTLQAFCSSITGTLATQAILKGVGVGDESATVLAATLTWLLKDGTGMVGRILFAWWKGSFLDCDCKRWRLFADVLNDFAIFLEICAPHFDVFFTPIVCVAGVCKSIVGVAGGATRAALTQHQALRNNMADVSAKDGSQETLVNLAGLICNLMLVQLVAGTQSLVWFLFILFTALHLMSNYKAVKSVCMSTFNQARLSIVVKDYLDKNCFHDVMDVPTANQLEPVLFGQKRYFCVQLGHSIKPLLNSFKEFEKLTIIYRDCNYLLYQEAGNIYVILHKDATFADQLRASFQTEVMEWAINKSIHVNETDKPNMQLSNLVSAASTPDDALHFIRQTHFFTMNVFPQFLQGAVMTSGWRSDPVLFSADEWRAQWNPYEIQDNTKEK